MTRRSGGTCTVRKTRAPPVSSMPLLPLRKCFSSTSLSGSRATSAALTSRCSPLAKSVTTMAARRAARSALRSLRMASFTRSIHLLDVDPDGAAAGEPDLPGGLVGDAEFERLGFAAVDHVEGFGDHRALDAAAGDTP